MVACVVDYCTARSLGSHISSGMYLQALYNQGPLARRKFRRKTGGYSSGLFGTPVKFCAPVEHGKGQQPYLICRWRITVAPQTQNARQAKTHHVLDIGDCRLPFTQYEPASSTTTTTGSLISNLRAHRDMQDWPALLCSFQFRKQVAGHWKNKRDKPFSLKCMMHDSNRNIVPQTSSIYGGLAIMTPKL